MHMQSAVRKAFGVALCAAVTATALPAMATTVSVTNPGNITVSSSSAGVLRFRQGVAGQSNLNVTVTCIVNFTGTVAAASGATLPASLVTVTGGTFAAGSSQCPSVTLKDSTTGAKVTTSDTLPGIITSYPAGGPATGTLGNVELSQPALGNCIAKTGQTITATYTNPTATAAGILTLKGPFYIGKAVALGDSVDDYCYSATDIPLTVSSPASFSAQPSITSP